MKEDGTSKLVFRTLLFVFGVFLLALTYNLFLLPNDLVVGGMSGLAVIFKRLFGWNPTLFIYISSFALLITSFLLLGKEQSKNTIIGSILYPIMVSATAPIAKVILSHSDLTEYLVIVCLASCMYGISNGLIYKEGYTTGGGDVIMQILSKYLNIPAAVSNFIYSFVIIFLSGIVFGISTFIYALIILFISNILINRIIVGISNSKVFYICTSKVAEVKELIKTEFESGYTILNSSSGFLHKKGEVIMVVIPNRNYYSLKNRILEIDSEAFFIINDCYEVNGGVRADIIPYF